MSPHSAKSPARVTVGMPGSGDRLAGALQGAYRRDRELPSDMMALLNEIDRKTGR